MTPLKLRHLQAHNDKDKSLLGLKLRAEYCDFMAATTPKEASYWRESAARRRREMAALLKENSFAEPPQNRQTA